MYIKNELSLFKVNLKSLLVNQRIGRIPYIFGCLFISIQKILIYMMILGCFSDNFDYQHIGLIASQIIAIIAYSILIIFRLHDIGKSIVNIIYIVGIYIIIHLFWGMELSFTSIVNTFLYSALYPIDSIIIYILPIMFLGIFPCTEMKNKFGLGNSDDIVDNTIITYGNSKFIFRLNKELIDKIFEYTWNVLFSRFADIQGRSTREEFILGILGGRVLISILMYSFIAIVIFIYQHYPLLYIPKWGLLVPYIWPLIAFITLSIRRLHDSMLSGIWLIGLIIPYVNVYVLYHLLLKASWRVK